MLRFVIAVIGLGIRTRPSTDCITSRAGALSQRGTFAGTTCIGSNVTGRS